MLNIRKAFEDDGSGRWNFTKKLSYNLGFCMGRLDLRARYPIARELPYAGDILEKLRELFIDETDPLVRERSLECLFNEIIRAHNSDTVVEAIARAYEDLFKLVKEEFGEDCSIFLDHEENKKQIEKEMDSRRWLWNLN